MRVRAPVLRVLVVALALLWLVPISYATSVRQVTLEGSLAAAELVFHGVVVERRSYAAGAPDAIFTRVRFQVLDVLKGPAQLTELELDFAGGTVGQYTVAIADLQIPEVGEEGVYFVESLQRRQANPFYGWQQGQFLVAEEDAAPRVRTATRHPVYGIGPGDGPTRLELSTGTPLGVQVEPATPGALPMTVDEFKAQLRRMGGQR